MEDRQEIDRVRENPNYGLSLDISKRTNKTNSKSVKQRKNNKQKSNIIQIVRLHL